MLTFSACKFYNNGGDDLFWTINSTFVLYLSEVISNRPYFGAFLAGNSTIIVENSYISKNVAMHEILYMTQSFVSVKNTTILGNIALSGNILYVHKSTFKLEDIFIVANSGEDTIKLEENHEVNIIGELIFANNSGTFLISNSNVHFFNTATFQYCNGSIVLSSIFPIGGAVTSMGSNIWFYDSVIFLNNYSYDVGGGFCAIGSIVYVYKSILISNNQAEKSGSGLYLYMSTFVCARHCNIAENGAAIRNSKGGGIHAYDSKIIFGNVSSEFTDASESVIFIIKGNFAAKGGGMYLEANSKLVFPKNIKYRLKFEDNDASKGEAMYIDDDTYLNACSGHYMQCVFQVSLLNESDLHRSWMQFLGKTSQTTLSGGHLDKCYINDDIFKYYDVDLIQGIDYLKMVTNDHNISRLITSKAVRVQFCQSNSNIYVKKGEEFIVQIVALDQVNHTVEADISSHLMSTDYSHLKKDQDSQFISAECTNLSFNVYSLEKNETLYIYPKSQCGFKENEALHVNITFKECTCRTGFYVLLNELKDCKCACDPNIFSRLPQCNISTVVRNNRYWIGYNNDTGFLFHPFCPYDFCLPPDTVVSIDLNLPNGSDAQCDFNRTGLLCGRCKPGYSLSLSSSHCV